MKRARTGDINGFLDRTTVVNGELRFSDTMRIDGRVSGRIASENLLIIGETAEIDAEIEVASVTIMGKVSGVVRASNRVEVLAGASLRADVITPTIRIDEGAFFQGRIDMAADEAAELPAHLALVDSTKSEG